MQPLAPVWGFWVGGYRKKTGDFFFFGGGKLASSILVDQQSSEFKLTKWKWLNTKSGAREFPAMLGPPAEGCPFTNSFWGRVPLQ